MSEIRSLEGVIRSIAERFLPGVTLYPQDAVRGVPDDVRLHRFDSINEKGQAEPNAVHVATDGAGCATVYVRPDSENIQQYHVLLSEFIPLV